MHEGHLCVRYISAIFSLASMKYGLSSVIDCSSESALSTSPLDRARSAFATEILECVFVCACVCCHNEL